MPEPSLSSSLTLQYEAEALGAGLPPLFIDAERLASTVHLGVHGRRKAGMGETFWQFRRYRPEDAAAAIDWRQSGKSQHLFVREREWEAAEAAWFWVDRSAGMQFASGKTKKAERATLLALALASLLVRGGERVALYGEAEAPASSRAALRRMGHALLDRREVEGQLPPESVISRNAQFVWFSDFLSPLSDIEAALKRLAHSAVTGQLVHIIDPAEEDFPFEGRVRFEEPSGGLHETLGRAETVGAAYRNRFKAHSEALRALARRHGWSTIAHRTDRAPQTALIALYADMSGA
ncbi:MAG: DUF58 domain-containing protein [Alphaproteobacteria bacterium]|nr:DUF58 domain-containing protein [Alphaproteobacteria bacterium]